MNERNKILLHICVISNLMGSKHFRKNTRVSIPRLPFAIFSPSSIHFYDCLLFSQNFSSGAATEDADVIFRTERKLAALPKTENRQADQYLAGWSDPFPWQLAAARQCAAHAWNERRLYNTPTIEPESGV